MKDKTILVGGLSYNNGGIEATVQNYCRLLIEDGYKVDFLVLGDIMANEEKFLRLGCRVFKAPTARQNYKEYSRIIDKVLNETSYDVVWDNRDSLANLHFLKAAKRFGVPVRIIHGHTMTNLGGYAKGILHNVNRRIKIKSIANRFWAVSQNSADYFYSIKIQALNSFRIMPNCIEFEKYTFDDERRTAWRKKTGIGQKLILMVGRLQYPKNQEIIIKSLSYLTDKTAVLVMAGGGMDTDRLKQLASDLSIEDRCIFTGMLNQDKITDLLMSADVYAMPSFNEGLPMAYLEAQAAGLPCVISDVISPEADISDNIIRLSPYDTPQVWAKALDEFLLSDNRNELNEKAEKFSLQERKQELLKYFGE